MLGLLVYLRRIWPPTPALFARSIMITHPCSRVSLFLVGRSFVCPALAIKTLALKTSGIMPNAEDQE
jgi:hypothetical protein